ncbi:putative hemolysin [Shewanella sp.]|uniref:putative hemolysin n=1 Tax=Shewanella sp. TaxID=50422 RepID=UPI003F3BB250
MKLVSIALLTSVICSLLTGCDNSANSPSSTSTPAATDAPAVQLANPAATYCASLGGRSEIRKSAEGEQGICTLPNGEQHDEWELFRRDHPQHNPN